MSKVMVDRDDLRTLLQWAICIDNGKHDIVVPLLRLAGALERLEKKSRVKYKGLGPNCNKIAAIKVTRSITTMGLKEAKEWVEKPPQICSKKLGEALKNIGALVEGL